MPHRNFLHAYLAGEYDEQEETMEDCIPATQFSAARQLIRGEAQPHVTWHQGPDHDRAVVSFGDGRQVVIGPDGETIADSAKAGASLSRRYRRACDLLFIRDSAVADEWTMVPPTLPLSGAMCWENGAIAWENVVMHAESLSSDGRVWLLGGDLAGPFTAAELREAKP